MGSLSGALAITLLPWVAEQGELLGQGWDSGSGSLEVSGGLCQWTALRDCTSRSEELLSAWVLPGQHGTLFFTSEMFSSDIRLGRGNQDSPERVSGLTLSRV